MPSLFPSVSNFPLEASPILHVFADIQVITNETAGTGKVLVVKDVFPFRTVAVPSLPHTPLSL